MRENYLYIIILYPNEDSYKLLTPENKFHMIDVIQIKKKKWENELVSVWYVWTEKLHFVQNLSYCIIKSINLKA